MEGGKNDPRLKVAFKLSPDHVNPQYYQKMNVGLAVELFSPNVTAALKIFGKWCGKQNEYEPTILFTQKVHGLIVSMSSRSSEDALTPNGNSYKVSKCLSNIYLLLLQTPMNL